MHDDTTEEKRCPACSSQALARMHRTWWQRIVGRGITRKYRCLFCGHEFLERVANADTPERGA